MSKLIDATATQGFEKAIGNIIPIFIWQCPHCLRRFGQKGRKANQIKVVTALGEDMWCYECYEKGLEKGICYKFKKLTKKEKKKLKRERWKIKK